VRVVDEVASGPEFAVFVLVVIAAHLLSQEGLVHNQLLNTMREEAVVSVAAVSRFIVTSAEFQLALLSAEISYFIICQFYTHNK